jgi:hypothetical protein
MKKSKRQIFEDGGNIYDKTFTMASISNTVSFYIKVATLGGASFIWVVLCDLHGLHFYFSTFEGLI